MRPLLKQRRKIRSLCTQDFIDACFVKKREPRKNLKPKNQPGKLENLRIPIRQMLNHLEIAQNRATEGNLQNP